MPTSKSKSKSKSSSKGTTKRITTKDLDTRVTKLEQQHNKDESSNISHSEAEIDTSANIVDKLLTDGFTSKLIQNREIMIEDSYEQLAEYRNSKLTWREFNSQRMSQYMKDAKESGSDNPHKIAINKIAKEWLEYKKDFEEGVLNRQNEIDMFESELKELQNTNKLKQQVPTALVTYKDKEVYEVSEVIEYWTSEIKTAKGKEKGFVGGKFTGQSMKLRLEDGSVIYFLDLDRVMPSVAFSNGGFGSMEAFVEKDFTSKSDLDLYLAKLETKYGIGFDVVRDKEWKEFIATEDGSLQINDRSL